MLLYSRLQFIFRRGPLCILLLAWLLACGLEFLQYLKLLDLLGITPSGLPGIVLGNTFDPLDLLAYTLGAGMVAFAERLLRSKFYPNPPES